MRLAARAGHTAAAVSHSSVVVFGGWRQRACKQALPCSEFLNDLQLLRLERAQPQIACLDSCISASDGASSWASDGACDDGGPGSEYSRCSRGTDCSDCGPRLGELDLPTPLSEGDVAAGAQGLEAAVRLRETRGRWERPVFDGVAPLPRRGHTMTRVSPHLLGVGGDGAEADGRLEVDAEGTNEAQSTAEAAAVEAEADVVTQPEEDGDVALLVMFGASWLWNTTTQEGHSIFLNDVHLLQRVNATWSWQRLVVSGSPPRPRASHTATVTPDGQRLLVYGGYDEQGALADAHLLDLSQAPPVWWQLYTTGNTPATARFAHTATLFGTDLIIFGGLPAAGGASSSIELLNLVSLEMQTSAPIATRLAADAGLNASCSLLLGSEGSPVQRYSCRAATLR